MPSANRKTNRVQSTFFATVFMVSAAVVNTASADPTTGLNPITVVVDGVSTVYNGAVPNNIVGNDISIFEGTTPPTTVNNLPTQPFNGFPPGSCGNCQSLTQEGVGSIVPVNVGSIVPVNTDEVDPSRLAVEQVKETQEDVGSIVPVNTDEVDPSRLAVAQVKEIKLPSISAVSGLGSLAPAAGGAVDSPEAFANDHLANIGMWKQ